MLLEKRWTSFQHKKVYILHTYFFKKNVINNDILFQDNVTDPENGQEKDENVELQPLHHDEYQQVHNDNDDDDNDNNVDNDNEPKDNEESKL